MAFSGNDLAFFEEIPSWEECGEYFSYFCTFSWFVCIEDVEDSNRGKNGDRDEDALA